MCNLIKKLTLEARLINILSTQRIIITVVFYNFELLYYHFGDNISFLHVK